MLQSSLFFMSTRIGLSVLRLLGDYRCLQNIVRVRWEDRVNNDTVHHRILSKDSRLLTASIVLRRLQWLRQTVRMIAHRLSFRALVRVMNKAAGINVAIKPSIAVEVRRS